MDIVMAFSIQKNEEYKLKISNTCFSQPAAQDFHYQVWELLSQF